MQSAGISNESGLEFAWQLASIRIDLIQLLLFTKKLDGKNSSKCNGDFYRIFDRYKNGSG